MVGRTDFKGDLLYSIGVSGFIYPIIGHWIWGPGGWLATMDTPFRDFAGSTVVHTVGGVLALSGAIALFNMVFGRVRWLSAGTFALLGLSLWLVMERTRLGASVRATVDDFLDDLERQATS